MPNPISSYSWCTVSSPIAPGRQRRKGNATPENQAKPLNSSYSKENKVGFIQNLKNSEARSANP